MFRGKDHTFNTTMASRGQYNALDVIRGGVVDPNFLKFGSQFNGQGCGGGNSCIDSSSDTILFASGHTLQTGDQVNYDPAFGTVSTVGGLTSSTVYYVIVVNDRTIRLVQTQNPNDRDR